MRGFLQDVGYFGRMVSKAPGFFAIAVVTLALGIGANTAVFSVINAVLLRPLPFHEPDRLVRLFETEAAPGNYPFAGPDYLDWKAQARTFEGMSLFEYYRRANVSSGGRAESAVAITAEANFFDVLGVKPLLGRTFAGGEGTAGRNERVAIVSYGFWQRHFGGNPAIVGKSIDLDSRRHTVVGVMPSGFNYPKGTEVWMPLDMSPQNLGPRGFHSYLAVGRLKPGVSASQALAELTVIARRLEQQYPDSNEKVGAAVVPMKEQLTRASREPLLILLGAVAFVLLVACANVANLLLIRASGRRRELAIRAALGAGRGRVVRQLLTESVLLALAGAIAGLVAAWWSIRLLGSVKSLPLPLVNPIQIDSGVLLFTLTAALVTGVLFGTLPALQGSAELGEELKASTHSTGGTGTRARRWRDLIAVAEIAVSVALLVGAGLLLRSFERMRHAEIGADARNVVTMAVNLPASRYDAAVARHSFYERLLERVRSTPGVLAASVSTNIPLEGGSNGYITVPGQDDARLKNQLFEWNSVSADYFRTFGIPLQQGRAFSPREEEQALGVAVKINEVFSSPNPRLDALKGLTWPGVINRSMARLVWPDQDPIGKTFILGSVVAVRVVGVAADVAPRGIRSGILPQAYFPFTSALSGGGSGNVTVRSVGRPMALVPSIRAHVTALDPTLAVVDPRTMDDVIADGMADTTLQTRLLGAFAALAAVLAAVGLYSVMAFLVAQRRRELGIRIALGAGHPDLLWLVLGHGTKLIVVGLVAGLGAAVWLTRLMRGLLFGVAPNDLATFAAVSCVLVLVAAAACAIPARRAMRVDPIVALRYE